MSVAHLLTDEPSGPNTRTSVLIFGRPPGGVTQKIFHVYHTSSTPLTSYRKRGAAFLYVLTNKHVLPRYKAVVSRPGNSTCELG